jgi:hypothetical protein
MSLYKGGGMPELNLSLSEVKLIEPPMAIYCFKPGAFFTFGVQGKTHSLYSHFMWLVGKNEVATQGWVFKSATLDDYSKYYMKFVYKTDWTAEQKRKIIESLRADLAKPKWETRYDVWALFGHLLNMKWIQSKQFEVCSDSGDHFKHGDDRYNLKDPTPEDVNKWTKSVGGYEVYGRYCAGD